MQIYDEMQIGTARVTNDEMQGIKHYMVGMVKPTKRYSVSESKKEAEKALSEIISKNKTPIIVGGTGLYVNSLVYGIDYPEIETDLEYRKKLEDRVQNEGLESLYEKAKKIDSEAMKKISENDQKRILRILEIYHQTGKTKTQMEEESRKNGIKYDYRVFAIDMPREILYDRINRRVNIMLEQGLIQEVKELYEKYGEELYTSAQAIGYKEVIDYFKRKLYKRRDDRKNKNGNQKVCQKANNMV